VSSQHARPRDLEQASQALVPLLGTNLFLSPDGEPPQVLRHVFPDLCSPRRDILTRYLRHVQVISWFPLRTNA